MASRRGVASWRQVLPPRAGRAAAAAGRQGAAAEDAHGPGPTGKTTRRLGRAGALSTSEVVRSRMSMYDTLYIFAQM